MKKLTGWTAAEAEAIRQERDLVGTPVELTIKVLTFQDGSQPLVDAVEAIDDEFDMHGNAGDELFIDWQTDATLVEDEPATGGECIASPADVVVREALRLPQVGVVSLLANGILMLHRVLCDIRDDARKI